MLYYPGCTVKTTARAYEKAAIGVLKEFNIDVIELSSWTCCGVYPGLSKDNYYHLVAPIRNLVYAQEEMKEKKIDNTYLLTLCSMCFNTLKFANLEYKQNDEARERVFYFMDTEPYYEAKIRVVHFMEVMRDIIGIKNLRRKVIHVLNGLNVAPFYGCYLLRPEGIGIDDPDNPTVMEDIMRSIGAGVVDYPYKTQCCGGYLVTKDPDAVWDRVYVIVKAAIDRGANNIVTTCPLCAFNLEEGQKRRKDDLGDILPVFFEPELIALALGKEEYIEKERLEILNNLLKK